MRIQFWCLILLLILGLGLVVFYLNRDEEQGDENVIEKTPRAIPTNLVEWARTGGVDSGVVVREVTREKIVVTPDRVQEVVEILYPSSGSGVKATIKKVRSGYTRGEVMEALNQLARRLGGEDKDFLFSSIADAPEVLEFGEGMQVVDVIENDGLRVDVWEKLFRAWTSKAPLEALAYAYQTPPDDLAEGKIPSHISLTAKDAIPEVNSELFRVLVSTLEDDQLDSTLGTVFTESPGIAAMWAESISPGEFKDFAIRKMMALWSVTDPLAAEDWLREQEITPSQMPAIRAEFGQGWASLDPDRALDWFFRLADDERTPEILERIFESYIQYDEEAALNWLDAQPDTPATIPLIDRYFPPPVPE